MYSNFPGWVNDFPNQMSYTPQPQFRLLTKGKGIDSNEFHAITTSAKECFMSNSNIPLSTALTNSIKNRIGGEWFAFISAVGSKNFDFCLTCVRGADFISFSLDNTLFQVCRLRD